MPSNKVDRVSHLVFTHVAVDRTAGCCPGVFDFEPDAGLVRLRTFRLLRLCKFQKGFSAVPKGPEARAAQPVTG